jgi:hypothetical protein
VSTPAPEPVVEPADGPEAPIAPEVTPETPDVSAPEPVDAPVEPVEAPVDVPTDVSAETPVDVTVDTPEAPVAEAPVETAPIVDEPASDAAPADQSAPDAPTEPILNPEHPHHTTRNIIIVVVTVIVLAAVGLLTWKLLQPALQPPSKGEETAQESTEDTNPVDPFQATLDRIKADQPAVNIVDLKGDNQTGVSLQDPELKVKVTASTVIDGLEGAVAADNTIVAVNLDVINDATDTAFTLPSLALTHSGISYAPITAITSNEHIGSFINTYSIENLVDVNAGASQAGWIFFEVPKTAVDKLALTYTRSIPTEFTASLDLTNK